MTLKEEIKNILAKIDKMRTRKAIKRLPVELWAAVHHELSGLYETSDKTERREIVRRSFEAIKKECISEIDSRIEQADIFYREKLNRIYASILPPQRKTPAINIRHDLLEEKAKAKLNMKGIEGKIIKLQQITKPVLMFASLGILLSCLGNYLTLNLMLGLDWAGGDQRMTSLVNAGFALLLGVFEVLGFHLALTLLPERIGIRGAKIVIFIGAVMLIGAVILFILARSEIGEVPLNNLTGVIE